MTGTFEGVGTLQFTPDNKLAYGFSGLFEFDNSGFKAGLDFTTESEYLIGRVYWGYPEDSSDNIQSQIYLNDVKVYAQFHSYTGHDYQSAPMFLDIVIPPFTNCKVGAINGDGNQRDCLVTFNAKVYGAIQQENLEAISNNNKWAKL